jgi:hypothetical protein
MQFAEDPHLNAIEATVPVLARPKRLFLASR